MMMSDSHRAMIRTYGVLVGRVLMGLLFLVSGFYKLTGPGGVSGFSDGLEAMGLPLPILIGWLVVLTEIGGGAALMLGYRVGQAAGALLIFLLLTVVLVHNPFKDMSQLTQALKNLAVAGGLLYVMAYGPGEGWKLR